MTMREALIDKLESCPACSADDVPDDLSAEEIAEYIAIHGGVDTSALSDEEVRMIADASVRTEGRSTFLRPSRFARPPTPLIQIGGLRIRPDNLP